MIPDPTPKISVRGVHSAISRRVRDTGFTKALAPETAGIAAAAGTTLGVGLITGDGVGVVHPEGCATLHDLGLAARWCTRLIMMDGGGVVADGPPAAVLTAENLRRVYGIEAYFGKADGGPVIMPTRLSPK